MHWMVCSVYYLGCMVVNIDTLFAEWSMTERDYFLRYCWLGFFQHGTHYLFSDIDAVMATFHVLVNISSTSDLHCFGSVCWFLSLNNKFLFPRWAFHPHFRCCTPLSSKMPLKSLKWSTTTTDLSWFRSKMQSTFTFFPSFLPSWSFHTASINHW